MTDLTIAITGVSITPNPVQTGKIYTVSADIEDILYALAADESCALTDNDDIAMESPDDMIIMFADNDGTVLAASEGIILEIKEES